MNKYLLFSMLMFSGIALQGQELSEYQSKWMIRPAVGVILPFTSVFKGEVTDDLVLYSDQSFYWEFISASYFFHKRWGVELNIQGSTSGKISGKNERFKTSLESEYGNDYYITPALTYQDAPGNTIFHGYLGLIYRYESKRFLVYPQFAIGVTSTYPRESHSFLKEKNANRQLALAYVADEFGDHFTISPSVVLGYKISRRFYWTVDIAATYFKAKFSITKTTTDLYTDEVTTENFDYNSQIFNVKLGTGLIIVLGFRD